MGEKEEDKREGRGREGEEGAGRRKPTMWRRRQRKKEAACEMGFDRKRQIGKEGREREEAIKTGRHMGKRCGSQGTVCRAVGEEKVG